MSQVVLFLCLLGALAADALFRARIGDVRRITFELLFVGMPEDPDAYFAEGARWFLADPPLARELRRCEARGRARFAFGSGGFSAPPYTGRARLPASRA